MKRTIFMTLITATIFIGTVVNAQTNPAAKSSASGSTILKVTLTDVLSIMVNQSVVSLNFLTPADYQNGVSTIMNNHLTVTSNQAYDLNVKSDLSSLKGEKAGNSASLDAKIITIEVDNASGQGLGGIPSVVTALSTTDQFLLKNAIPVTNKSINIKYAIPGSISSTDAVLGKPADTYSTLVTYTISQI